jgi:hypothetical protein
VVVRILNEKRKPVGYLDVPAMKRKYERKEVSPEDSLGESDHIYRWVWEDIDWAAHHFILELYNSITIAILHNIQSTRYFNCFITPHLPLYDYHPVARHTTLFPLKSKSHPYTIITPLTPLEQLESFFSTTGTDFALGTYLTTLVWIV